LVANADLETIFALESPNMWSGASSFKKVFYGADFLPCPAAICRGRVIPPIIVP